MDVELNIEHQMIHVEWNQIMTVHVSVCNYNGNDLRGCKQKELGNIDLRLNWNEIVTWNNFLHLNDVETIPNIRQLMACVLNMIKCVMI